MAKCKKYLYLASSLILFNLLISMLYLFTNISYNVISSILLVYYLICFMILGFMIAKTSNKKGLIIGLITGFTSILVLFILGLLFHEQLSLKIIIYYLLVLLSIILGSIVSKNTKK